MADCLSVVQALTARLNMESDLRATGVTSVPAVGQELARRCYRVLIADMTLLGDTGGNVMPASRTPRADPARVVGRLARHRSGMGIVVLATPRDEQHAGAVAAAGVRGWVSKNATVTTLLATVRAVSRGEARFPPRVLGRVLAGMGPASGLGAAADSYRTSRSDVDARRAIAALTSREREILRHLVRGMDRAAIARELVVSPHTVRTHVANLFRKLGVHSTLEAVVVARRASGSG